MKRICNRLLFGEKRYILLMAFTPPEWVLWQAKRTFLFNYDLKLLLTRRQMICLFEVIFRTESLNIPPFSHLWNHLHELWVFLLQNIIEHLRIMLFFDFLAKDLSIKCSQKKPVYFHPDSLPSINQCFRYYFCINKYSYVFSIGYFSKNLSDKLSISHINYQRPFHLDFKGMPHYYSSSHTQTHTYTYLTKYDPYRLDRINNIPDWYYWTRRLAGKATAISRWLFSW